VMPGDPADLSVCTGRAATYAPVAITANAEPGTSVTIRGLATHQICDDQNCFPPASAEWSVDVPVAAESVPADDAAFFEDFSDRQVQAAAAGGADTDAALEAIVGGDATRWSAGWAFLMAICAGLIFNIMPCVLPV